MLAIADPLAISGGEVLKPFDSYPGSKDAAGVAEQIIARFPPHCCYVEPFLGGGAVLRKKRPALRTIGMDLDKSVIDAWRRVAWPGLELHWRDGLNWLMGEEATALPPDALVYCDPPYLLRTRGHRQIYQCELSDEEHNWLLHAIQALPCTVFISGYDDALYRRKLSGWAHSSFPAMTRGGLRTEHLWWRSTIASFGGDTRYAGRNFRERERIKRKATRWAARIRALPGPERAAVVAAVLAANGDAGSPPAASPEITMLQETAP